MNAFPWRPTQEFKQKGVLVGIFPTALFSCLRSAF